MDTSNGRIYKVPDVLDEDGLEKWEKLKVKLGNKLVGMKVQPTAKQMRRVPPRVGRNEPCPCGSGKKFKKCCLTPDPPAKEDK